MQPLGLEVPAWFWFLGPCAYVPTDIPGKYFKNPDPLIPI